MYNITIATYFKPLQLPSIGTTVTIDDRLNLYSYSYMYIIHDSYLFKPI
jgi:hypothetical protein